MEKSKITLSDDLIEFINGFISKLDQNDKTALYFSLESKKAHHLGPIGIRVSHCYSYTFIVF